MHKLFTSFLKGLLILVPLAVTAFVIYSVFVKIDGLLGIPIRGVGFVVTILAIIIVGAVASNLFIARLFAIFEKGLTRLPVVKLLYFSIKDLIGAFVGEKKMFNRPVMVSLGADGGALAPISGVVDVANGSKDDIKLLGFITTEHVDFLPAGDRVAVYIPQSYNMGGYMILVPKERITPLTNVESAKLLAFIVSGGVARGVN